MPSAPPVPDRRTPAPAPPDKAAADPAAARGANAAKAPAQSGAPGPGTAPAKPAGAANAGTAGAAKAGTADKAQTTPGARGAQAAPQPGAVARADQLAVRAKLAVSQPGDASEREADAVADRVSRQWDPAAGRTGGVSGVSGGKPGAGPAGPAAKRPEAGAAPVARAPDEPAPSAKEPAARSEAGAEPVHGPTGPLQVDAQPIQQRRGLGEPLPEGVRQQMESQLGHDLSAVRVHHDEQAQQLCRSLRAQAFTSGDDVFFAAGRYQPNSRAGVTLLAHELTHVAQHRQDSATVSRKLDPDLPDTWEPRSKTATAKALSALGELQIPAVKARHLPLYQRLLPDKLRRKRGYDRGSPAQVGVWLNGMKISEAAIRKKLTGRGLNNVPADADESFKLKIGTDKKAQSKSIRQLQTQLKIPTWSKHGKPVGTGFQVDHVVELQVSGEHGEGVGNSLQNMELLDQPSNSSSGGAIRSGIYAKVDAYLATFKDPAPVRRSFLKQHDLVFESVSASLGMGSAAGESSWWSYEEIKNADPLDTVTPAPPVDEEGTCKEFLLADAPGGIVVQRFKHDGSGGSFDISGSASKALAGLTMSSLTLNKNAAKGSGTIGSIAATWSLPKKWQPAHPDTTLTLTGDGQYRGYPSKLGGVAMEFEPLSPVTFDEVEIAGGKVQSRGVLKPSLSLLQGTEISVALSGREIEFGIDFASTQLHLDAPGVQVEEARVRASYSTARDFSLAGQIGFAVDKVGGGELEVAYRGGAVSVAGQFDFRSELFDKAQLRGWWRQGEGFGAEGELAITQPGRFKGLKSATLKATYSSAAKQFSASGSAEVDIPGVKNFTAQAEFKDEDHFTVGGSAELGPMPGLASGSLSLTLSKGDTGWEFSGSGSAVPKLPGGATGSIEGSYRKGVVLMRGQVHFSYGGGLLDGDVKVAVTNAASVDAQGNAGGEPGTDYKVFGEGTLRAQLIKDRLDGTLKMRLLEDGSVRVGGKLTAAPFDVFGKYPADGGEFLNKTLSTPPVPLPGLGFSVGSVSVGVTFSASLTMKAHAAIGPGKLEGISLGVEEFDPAAVTLSTLKFTGGGTFKVFADAGFSASAAVNLIFGAAVAELVGSVGAEASVGIPKDKPLLSAHADFSYSQTDGLDLNGTMNLDIAPALKFRLFGQVSARLNLLVDTVTVWSKDWTLAEANYQLPVGIHASGQLGYNSKSGKITPSDPSQAIKVETPKLDGDAIKGVLLGDSAPPKVQNQTEAPRQNAPAVHPKRRGSAAAAPDQPPPPVDEDLVQRLGSGAPLDGATRGFFEQQLGQDLSRVQVHVGPGAQREAEQLSAHAFTVGQHIAFAEGEYQPDSQQGRALLAHELAHVVQHSGARPTAAMRQATTGAGASATVATAGQSYSVASGPHAGAQIHLDPTDRRLSLPTLRLPALKQRNSTLFPTPLPVRQGSRPATDQTTLWRAAVQAAAQTQLNSLTTAARTEGAIDDSSGATQFFLTLDRAPSFLLFGTEDTLRPRLELPIWDRQGRGTNFQVDHVREMQLDGSDTDSNYELLEGGANMGAGRAIADEIRTTMQDGLQALHDANPAAAGLPAPSSWRQVKNNYRVSYAALRFTLPHDGSAGGDRFWSKQAVIDGHAAAMLRPMSATERTRLGRGGAPVLFASASGGEPLPAVTHPRRDWLPRVDLLSWTPAAVGSTGDLMGTLSVDVLKARSGAARASGVGVAPDYPAQSWLVKRVPGLNAGSVDPASVQMGVRNSLRLPGMSPIEMGEVSLSRAGLLGEGRVLPTVPLIADADIRIRLNGAEAQVFKTFSMDELRLPAPFHLDACDLTVFYGQRSGLGLEGRAEFSVDRLGSGHLAAAVSTGGGFALEGGFELDSALFDRAHVAMAYRDEQLSLDGEVGIDTPGKVRGIRAAHLHLSYTEGGFSADGSVDPDIPGVRQAALRMGYGEDSGLTIGGRLELEANPAIRSGAIDVTLNQTDGRWRVSASGTAEPAIPGVDSTLRVAYDDGAFDASFSGAFQRGMLSGTAELGATNRPLDASGQPSGAPEPGAPLIVYGGGSATIRLAPWLQGTAGIRFSPAGECTLSGEIALPDTLQLFPRQQIERSLFSLSTQIPIVPGIVAEVGGNLRANAGIGPGVLDEARIGIEYSPDHEENTHVTGDAHLSVPADAGLRLGARAGIGLGITGASATGGLELGGSLGIAGAAEASVHVDWMPSQGLQIDAEAAVRAAPRFRFDVSGYVDVSVLGASLYEQTWELAACEVGADYAFGVRFPLRYREGEPFSVSTEDIEFEVPEIDPEALLGELGGQLF